MKKSFFSVPRTLPLHALTTFLIGVGCVWPLSLSLGLTAPLSLCLTACGAAARMMPVPRKLSASCGTCVSYQADDPLLDRMDTDVERVFAVDGDSYTLLLENE